VFSIHLLLPFPPFHLLILSMKLNTGFRRWKGNEEFLDKNESNAPKTPQQCRQCKTSQ
jgi:hypothetical protein